MSEQGQEDADPNANLDQEKLFNLMCDKKWNEAIEFLNNDRLSHITKK